MVGVVGVVEEVDLYCCIGVCGVDEGEFFDEVVG